MMGAIGAALGSVWRVFGITPGKPPIIGENMRWYIRHKRTGLYLGSCHTTGDGIWTDKANAESWHSEELARHDGLAFHPFKRLRESVVNIVYEEEKEQKT